MSPATRRRPRPGALASTADALIGSAQALETAAKHLRDRARRIRAGYDQYTQSPIDHRGWGKSDIRNGCTKALSQLEEEGGS